MSEQISRNYKVKDVDMLLASSTIVESAITNKTVLLAKRSNWADPYFANLKTRIDKAIDTHLGIDNAKQLRIATQTVLGIQKTALKDLAELKVQIIEDFKKEPNTQKEILITLGFTSYDKASKTGDQEALINLLYQFKANLTPTLKTQIVAKGTAATLLDGILAYAKVLKDADVTQESKKGTRKEITATAIIEFNNIYDEIISIANISKKFFKDNLPLRDQFSFNKVTGKINLQKSQTPPTP
jgi:hypothetical protein